MPGQVVHAPVLDGCTVCHLDHLHGEFDRIGSTKMKGVASPCPLVGGKLDAGQDVPTKLNVLFQPLNENLRTKPLLPGSFTINSRTSLWPTR